MDVKYRFNGFTVDPVRKLLFGADGQPVPLKSRVFDVLLHLVEHRGQLLEKQTLLDAVWPHVIVEENNLSQAISTLRAVFGETRGEHRFIVTEPGRGYRFVARVDVVHAEAIVATPIVATPIAATPVRRRSALILTAGLMALVGLAATAWSWKRAASERWAREEAIPYLGPWLGAIPPFLYALVVHPLSALWVVLLFLGIHQIEGHVVVPNVMGNALRLHPLLVIFGLGAGAELYGLPGALVALPVLAVGRALWEFFSGRISLEPWGHATPEEQLPVEPLAGPAAVERR